MPGATPLGIPTMLDSDPLADVAQANRDGFEAVDDMLTSRAAAWNQASTTVGAGATVGMGSATLPACTKLTTLHIAVLHDNTAATENFLTLTPDYTDNARVADLGPLRWATGATATQQMTFFALPLAAGSDATSMSFTITAFAALDAARVLTWIS